MQALLADRHQQEHITLPSKACQAVSNKMDRLSSDVTTQVWATAPALKPFSRKKMLLVTTLLVEVDAFDAYLAVGEVAIVTGSYALHNDLDNICEQVSSRLDHRFCLCHCSRIKC